MDVSASTDAWVSGALRIIDVEKESLIVLLEALDALGDPHAALAFSGEGPGEVRVLTIKDFDEPAGLHVRRRVAALEPDRYTRARRLPRRACRVSCPSAWPSTARRPRTCPSVFGRRGYAPLRRQELLPGVLVEVVRRLLVS